MDVTAEKLFRNIRTNMNKVIKGHRHPCICDVKMYKRKPLSLQEVSSKNYQQILPDETGTKPPTPEEIRKAQEERLAQKRQEYRQQGCIVTPVKGTNYIMQYRRPYEQEMQGRRGKINWKKSPLIAINQTKASKLRKLNRRYCGRILQHSKSKVIVPKVPAPLSM